MHRARNNSNSLSVLPRHISYPTVIRKVPSNLFHKRKESSSKFRILKNTSELIKKDFSTQVQSNFPRFIPHSRQYIQLSPGKNEYDLKGKSMEKDRKSLEKLIDIEKTTKRANDLHSQLRSFNLKSAKLSIMKKIEMLKTPEDKQNIVKAEGFLKEVKSNNLETVQEMLQVDWSLVNLVDSTKQTALHWACRRGYMALVELLIKYKASSTQADMVGRTPEDIARSKNHFEIIDFFTRSKRIQRQITIRYL